MNHCLLEVEVLEAPQVRYTQDNQTPVAEMAVQMDGLRPDDPPAQLKVVGWGNLAQELQNRVQVGQRLRTAAGQGASTLANTAGLSGHPGGRPAERWEQFVSSGTSAWCSW